MNYDGMGPAGRTKAAHAVARFLLENDYASLQEACEALELSPQDLWDRILAESSLPPCEISTFAPFVSTK